MQAQAEFLANHPSPRELGLSCSASAICVCPDPWKGPCHQSLIVINIMS